MKIRFISLAVLLISVSLLTLHVFGGGKKGGGGTNIPSQGGSNTMFVYFHFDMYNPNKKNRALLQRSSGSKRGFLGNTAGFSPREACGGCSKSPILVVFRCINS